MTKITVLGAGTWAVALARLLKNKGLDVTMWSALEKEIDVLKTTNSHPNLPGCVVPEGINYTLDIAEAVTDRDLIVFGVSSPFVRATARNAAKYIKDGQIIVDVAKGIETSTHLTLTQVIEDEITKDDPSKKVRLVALSGPTHAEEVSLDMLTTIVAASEDEEAALFVQDVFTTDTMRVYTNPDAKGVEICGSLKNAIALASGMLYGLGHGDNARAALITRGMAEITRLGRTLGCNEKTFYGLAGIGDLIVTATSQHSRNNNCGRLIGEGLSPAEAIEKVGMVVEGINVLPAIMELSKTNNVEMPICEAVNAVVNLGADPGTTIASLMTRDKKPEY